VAGGGGQVRAAGEDTVQAFSLAGVEVVGFG